MSIVDTAKESYSATPGLNFLHSMLAGIYLPAVRRQLVLYLFHAQTNFHSVKSTRAKCFLLELYNVYLSVFV